MDRVPFLIEWAIPAQGRGLVFVAEIPLIYGEYDDGDDCGRVLIVGPGRDIEDAFGEVRQTVRTHVMGTRDQFDVLPEFLTVDEATAANLAKSLQWIEAAKQRPVFSGGGCRARNFYAGAQR